MFSCLSLPSLPIWAPRSHRTLRAGLTNGPLLSTWSSRTSGSRLPRFSLWASWSQRPNWALRPLRTDRAIRSCLTLRPLGSNCPLFAFRPLWTGWTWRTNGPLCTYPFALIVDDKSPIDSDGCRVDITDNIKRLPSD